MEIKVTIRDPQQIRKQNGKFVIEASEISIDWFSVRDGDASTFKKLYSLGWRPSDYFLKNLCKILPAEFLVAHEPADRLVRVLRELWYDDDYTTIQKFSGFLQKGEKEKIVREVLVRKQETLQEYPQLWSDDDYRDISNLAKNFPEVFETPEWLAERILLDLGRTEEYKSRPLSRAGRCFAGCLITLAELKRLGKLPGTLERAAALAVDRICDTILERVRQTDLKSREDHIRVAEAAQALASDETGAKIAAALLKVT
jgi:hypothetical protein